MLKKIQKASRRQLRRSRKLIGGAAVDTDHSFETNVIKKLPKFKKIWKPVVAWLLLLVLLCGCVAAQIVSLNKYYQTLQPVSGGIYTEGVLGSFTNANPIYATNEVDRTVSRLVFAGLFTHDKNNKLTGDLAKNYRVDASGKVYTVTLRDKLFWHDGRPLTAADVVFTYRIIQNPDAQSPLRGSWQGVDVRALDAKTIQFTLPTPLASFMEGMTNGIVPEHLLKNVPMAGMRSNSFNTAGPVGAGPFRWQSIEVKNVDPRHAQETVGLVGYDEYHRGAPKLRSFVVRAFADQGDMVAAYKERELTAMTGVREVPKELAVGDYVAYAPSLTAATMVFFKTSDGVLADGAIRRALVAAARPAEIIELLGNSPKPVKEPLLIGQLGYDPRYAQKTGDMTVAKQLLDKAGWTMGADGIRSKNNRPLVFSLSFAETPEYQKTAKALQQQWRQVGVRLQLRPLDEASFRNVLGAHDYDAVLYGITIGVDPDVYVYWASSQTDVLSASRLNLSEYKSTVIDEALDAGRTRNDAQLRVIKYQGFLKRWQRDAPALGLYQPRYLYVSRSKVYGFPNSSLNRPADRLNHVHEWMIRTIRTTNN